MTDKAAIAQTTTGQNFTGGLGERSCFWILCLVCLIILFSSLGSTALFEPDEGRNAEKAREILLLNDWVTPHQNFLPTLDKPMAFYWLIAIAFKVFGISEWSARLPSALAAVGCIFLVYRFARHQWGSGEALWSGLVLITGFEFFLLSRIVISDMTLTFFIALALFSFYAVTQTDDPRSRKVNAFLMYAAMGVGTLVKGPIGLFIPCVVIFCYLLFTRRWFLLRRLNLPLGAIIYFAVVIPWNFWVEARNPGYLQHFLREEYLIRYLTPTFSRTKSWYYFFLVLGVGFLPWSFFIPFAVQNLWKRNLTEANLFLVLWVILPFAFFSVSNSKLPHYILPIYPALSILTGQALANRISDGSGKQSKIVYIPGIFAIGIVLYLLIGAGWPSFLTHQVRSTVVQNVYYIGVYGALISLVFGVLVVGHLKNLWRNEGGYICTAAGLALFLALVGYLMAAASYFRASKPWAEAMAPLINREDQLVFYDGYVEGLPFYLRIDKPIWLVRSREQENIIGSYYVAGRHPAPAAGFGQVVFSFQEFAERWKKNERPLKVFVREKNLDRLSSEIGSAPQLLMKVNDYLLVTAH